MTIEQIKQSLKTQEYDFLRTEPHLGNKIAMLALGGSYAYGTNIETSDVDIRGFALQSRAELLGVQNFEQVIDKATDTTIYGFNKLVRLLTDCNPNVIELLGNKPEHYLYLSDIGKEMLENKKMFLSKRAIHSFVGYANRQFRRLENALAKNRLTPEQKEQYVLDTMRVSMEQLAESYDILREECIKVTVPRAGEKITCSVNVDNYPLRDLGSLINSLTSIAKSFDKQKDMLHKKDLAHLNKHAMHLIRLYCICLDVLEKEEIVTYREAEHDVLMDIRAGKYQNPDGTYQSEFFELVHEYEDRLQYAKSNTSLLEKPDYKRIEEFVMSVNERALTV